MNVSEILELFATCGLTDTLTHSDKPGQVPASSLNPGSVKAGLGNIRTEGREKRTRSLWKAHVKPVGRSAEKGSKTLVYLGRQRTKAGQETHGQYLDDCQVGREGLIFRLLTADVGFYQTTGLAGLEILTATTCVYDLQFRHESVGG